MKLLRKQQVMRVAAGILLVALAALVTIFIKDALSLQKPENALPELSIFFGTNKADKQLPYEHIKRDRYTWKFTFFAPVSGGGVDPEAWRNVKPGYVDPGALLELEFSFDPDVTRVYMASADNPGNYTEQPAHLQAPSDPGQYTYRVEADWGTNRVVQYYFRIEIPPW